MVYIHGLPPGFVFAPTDEELIRDYLLPKVTNNPLPVDGLVQEHDLYGEQHPWQIFGFSQEKQKTYYVFTPLKKKTHETTRFIRTVGSGGTWKLNSSGDEVKNKHDRTVGTVKNLSYINKANKTRKCDGDKIGRWVMHEYSLENSFLGKFVLPGFQDYALCRIINFMDNLPQELGIKANRPLNYNNTREESGNEAGCSSSHMVPLVVATDEPRLTKTYNFGDFMGINDYFPFQLTDAVGDEVETTMPRESIMGSSISQPFVVSTPPTQPQEQYPDDFFDELGDITVLPNLCFENIHYSSIALFQEPNIGHHQPDMNEQLDPMGALFEDTPSIHMSDC